MKIQHLRRPERFRQSLIIRTGTNTEGRWCQFIFLAAFRGMTTDTGFPQEVAMFTFGQIPTYQSDERFELGVSDDKRALTLTFSDLQATVGGSKSPVPMSTRVFSLVLPLEGDEKRVE